MGIRPRRERVAPGCDLGPNDGRGWLGAMQGVMLGDCLYLPALATSSW